MCKTNTGMQTDLFEIIWESLAMILAFAMMSLTVAARILALASLPLASCKVVQR